MSWQASTSTIMTRVLMKNRLILSTQQFEEYYFKLLQSHNVGKMSFEMFMQCLDTLEYNVEALSNNTIKILFDYFDYDRTGISLDGFLQLSRFFILPKFQNANEVFIDEIYNIMNTNEEPLTFDEIQMFIENFENIDIDKDEFQQSLVEAFGHDNITYDRFVLGLLRSGGFFFKLLRLDPSKIHWKNEDFQVLCAQHGRGKYEANILFTTIDYDHGGSLDHHEIKEYIKYLEKGHSLWDKIIEIIILLVQVIFIFIIAAKMILYRMDWKIDAVDLSEIFMMIASGFLFTKMIFAKRWWDRKSIQIMEEILALVEADDEDLTIVKVD